MHMKSRIQEILELQRLFLSFFFRKKMIQNFHPQYNAIFAHPASHQSSRTVDCWTNIIGQAQPKTTDEERVIKYKIDTLCCYTPA
ncbi:hypothetical protein ACL9RI_07090 [Janthinobacterium sp. Mn2066]|uniref:hypothetical protein n=1 Tax=Janthinobacterium sp. Mn2066 TaxID=3395264 RepID=UPI003BD44A9F